MPTLSRWQNAWLTIGVPPSNRLNALFAEVVACYTENHRHYHTLQHLDECLEKFEELRPWAEYPAEIELALWFHDAVYDPARHDNEQLSAEWLKTSALAAKVNKTQAQKLYDLLMVTCHTALPKTMDEKIIVDADLAILAAYPARFSQYGQQIRREYAFVPDEVFNAKRTQILQAFLARQTIFNTGLFLNRYEQQARVNLSKAVEKL